jgi:hypothetical protein
VVWFLAGQTFSGLILSIGGMASGGSPVWLYNILSTLHFGWNPMGGIYRILLALAVFAQGISGIIIYYLIRTRSHKV